MEVLLMTQNKFNKTERLLPTSALGFMKSFATEGKEHLPLAFIQDIMINDKFKRKINKVRIGNPYNIIGVNTLSEGKIDQSATLEPVISLNILKYTHFDVAEAIHFFRLYDVVNQKYTNNPHQYTEIYFEVAKIDAKLSKKLKHWQHYFLTGEAFPDAPDYIKELASMMLLSNFTKDERKLYELSEKYKYKRMNREMYVDRIAREEERKKAEAEKQQIHEKYKYKQRVATERGIERGIEKGIEKGELNKSIKIARKLFGKGMDIHDISDTTDLDVEELSKLLT
jgi:predicted transposase/invertase (TIGR01784 family)